MTEAQQKFKEKIKKDLNYEVDFATYHITRGRGWSKADGACSATIDAIFTDSKGISGTVELFLQYPLKIYNRKKYRLTEWSDIYNQTFIDIEEISKRQ